MAPLADPSRPWSPVVLGVSPCIAPRACATGPCTPFPSTAGRNASWCPSVMPTDSSHEGGTVEHFALPDVLTVEETARLLRISRGLALAGVRSGDIPSVRIGRRILVPRAQLIEFLGGATTAGDGNESGVICGSLVLLRASTTCPESGCRPAGITGATVGLGHGCPWSPKARRHVARVGPSTLGSSTRGASTTTPLCRRHRAGKCG
jgi:excisionase family DNA binding protein